MCQLLYIHGFLSSPQSYKAQQMKAYLQLHHPNVAYHCPQLTPYPQTCAAVLEAIVDKAIAANETIALMGSSMGGFWATYLAERYNIPAVLINPAVEALDLMPKYIGQTLYNYHTEDVYYLTTDDLALLSRYDTPVITRTTNYWVFLQAGDETLDYRLAADRYRECQQTVEQGGDHCFQGFERFHSATLRFFEKFHYITKS